MKLLYRITTRLSLALLLLFAAWATVFYYIIIDEINDETDDSLEDYAEYIVTRALAGESLPEKDNGTNNSYHITEITPADASGKPAVRYSDEMVYIYSKKETEPARVLKTIFRDSDDRYFELTVSIPTIEKEDLQETILWWMVILYVILLIAIVAVNALVLRRSLRPLYALLDWLDELRLGKSIPPLENTTEVTEFRKLNEAMLRAASRNAEMYEQQSMFIGHASHELQTPIAIAQNRLEMLSNDQSLSEAQLEQILKTRQSLEQIARLNKTLLLLTKIENRQFGATAEININSMLGKLAEDFAEAYEHMGIRVSFEERVKLKVRMNETLASVLFGNLIKNAFIHNVNNGSVKIAVDRDSVTISNTSDSGALNPEYIFKRFYQGNKKEGSAGLGLSLVESVCKLYGLTVEYGFDNPVHRFRVKFPEGII